MELKNEKMTMDAFLREREDVVRTWPTGQDVDFEEGVRYQLALPERASASPARWPPRNARAGRCASRAPAWR